MVKGLSVSALALAVGLFGAGRLSAQSAPRQLICKDGTVTNVTRGALACFKHGGIDQQATVRAEQGQYGVYPNNGNGGNRGVYGGANDGSSRGVYDGRNGTGSNRAERAGRGRRHHEKWDRKHDRDRDDARDRDDDRNRNDDRRGQNNGRRTHGANGNRNGAVGRYDNRR